MNEENEPQNENFKCGMVSIVGRPNTGKSTLLNSIIGEKIAIVSPVPQTTRQRIRGMYNSDKGQIIFIDTPGLVMGKDKLDKLLQKASYGTLSEVDCIIHLVDANEQTGKEERAIVERINAVKVPVVLGLNKVDRNGKYADQYISLWEQIKGKKITEVPFFSILPLSGKTEFNIDKLIEILFEYLPKGPALYAADTISDTPQKLVIADIIREKFLNILKQEVPHSLAVRIDSIDESRKRLVSIKATILVERDSQKEIVIGKGGERLKEVGTLARMELEELLEKKVYLETFVKMQKNWRDDPASLDALGYNMF